jgi:hypothetical protein
LAWVKFEFFVTDLTRYVYFGGIDKEITSATEVRQFPIDREDHKAITVFFSFPHHQDNLL